MAFIFDAQDASLGLGFCGCDGHFWCLTQVSVGGSYWDLSNSTGLQARDSKGTPSCERVALDDVPCMKPMYSFDWDIHQKNQQELESSCSSKEHKDGQMYDDIEQWHLIYDIWQMIDDRWWYMIDDRWKMIDISDKLFMIYDRWYLIYDIWHMMYDRW